MPKPILVIIKNSIALQPGALEVFLQSDNYQKCHSQQQQQKKVDMGEGNLSELYEKLF